MSSRFCPKLLGVAAWLADLNGRGTTVALPDHPLFWAGFIVVGEP